MTVQQMIWPNQDWAVLVVAMVRTFALAGALSTAILSARRGEERFREEQSVDQHHSTKSPFCSQPDGPNKIQRSGCSG
jgi:hypothetical protein